MINVEFSQDLNFRLDFTQDGKLTYVHKAGQYKGKTETVSYTTKKIKGDVYMIYWHESDNTRVVHVHDYSNRKAPHIWTNIASQEKDFWHLEGDMKMEK